mgnify:CR=1 FL=1|tara:strand:+ start:137 stop:826 length:690 start_codon:yes stop_codon:yes gene_type:complete
MTKTAYITLTNKGYVEYTKNCLKTLSMIGKPELLEVYCIDQEAYDLLMDYPCKTLLQLPEDQQIKELQEFRQGNWNKVVYQKFRCIHKALLDNDFVYFTDGDIVYKSDKFITDLNNRMENKDIDLLIQNDKQSDDDDGELCSGLMFIRSNEKTRDFFDPKSIDINTIGCDQIYVNKMKQAIHYEKLPLCEYPNGLYHRTKNPNGFLIHYNYLIGNDKKKMMIIDSNWFI